ncbi:MAG: 4Fe-4S dicluster domain-containing protein [Bacillota bacterium]
MRRILINPELCSGCKNCLLACMAEHSREKTVLSLDLEDMATLSRNLVEPDMSGKPVPVICRHCDTPSCVSACISGAMTKDPDTGIVSSNPQKCAGCWMCVMSCPYGLVFPDSEGSVALKCNMCSGTKAPRCVEACPTGSISVYDPEPGIKTEGGLQ